MHIVQRVYRGGCVRVITLPRLEALWNAAIVIDAVARMHLARLELKRLRAAELQRRTDAAVTVQCVTRGYLFRKHLFRKLSYLWLAPPLGAPDKLQAF